MNEQLKINPVIKKTLKLHNIYEADGLMLLLAMYFGIKPSYIKDVQNYYYKLHNLLLQTGIISVDYTTDTIDWRIPLFGEYSDTFEDTWIRIYMDKYKEVNPDRRGDKQAVIKNLKRIKTEYPFLTKEKIMEATDYYLTNLEDYRYCKKSHKFLYDMNGSVLIQTIEKMNSEFLNQLNNII